jgi:hypothetical protein
MFEEEVDGTPRPCDHPIRWYHRLAAWAHNLTETIPYEQWNWFHNHLFPSWVCESYERVVFDFPCWQCEGDRVRDYGATVKSDYDVIAKFPTRDFGQVICTPADESPLPDEDDNECPADSGGHCCGCLKCNGYCP